MSCSRCCRSDYKGLAIVLAAAFGAILGYVYSLGLINPIALIWIAFGVAVVLGLFILGFFLFSNFRENRDRGKIACICRYCIGIIVGVIGAIILAVILLSIPLVVTTAVAVLFGLLAFFFAIALAFTVLLVLCILEGICGDQRDDDDCCYSCNDRENNHHFY